MPKDGNQIENGPADLASFYSNFGLILLDSYIHKDDLGMTQAISYVGPSFLIFSSDGSACTTINVGDCSFSQCTSGVPDAGGPSYARAGTVAVTGGSRTVSLSPNPDGTYPSYQANAALWSGGESLTISASGDVVPAFTGTLTAPAPMTVLAPLQSGIQPITIDRTKDLTIRWNGGTRLVQIYIATYSPYTSSILCKVPAASGSYIVPSTLLGRLAAGAANFGLQSTDDRYVISGDWKIELFARSSALLADGSIYYARVTLQ